MSAEEITDAEVVGTEIVPQEAAATPQTIFRTDDPLEIMQKTSEVATSLKQFVKDQGLVSVISKRDYIVVEGWQMLGMMLGVTPGKVKSRSVEHGWEAIVELHDRTGRVVGSGEAECLDTESTWKTRDDYARRSMAQTRAVGKAFRNTFGFIAKAAGFEATPAEEMPPDQATAEQAGPPYGPAVSDAQLAIARKAIAYLLRTGMDDAQVDAACKWIELDGGGYMPACAMRAITAVAKRVKDTNPEEAPPAEVRDAERLAAEHDSIAAEVFGESVEAGK